MNSSKVLMCFSSYSEWRQKLMDDLDDDEEFLSSSDDEDAGISQEDTCNKVSDEIPDQQLVNSEDMDADLNTKLANGLSRGNSQSSGISKCRGPPVVLDMGSYEIKAGIGGEYEPSHVFRNVLGKWRPQVGEAYSEAYGEILFGDDALAKHNALTLHHTFQGESIVNISVFKHLIRSGFHLHMYIYTIHIYVSHFRSLEKFGCMKGAVRSNLK